MRKIGELNKAVKKMESSLKDGTEKGKKAAVDYKDAKGLRQLCDAIDEFTPYLSIAFLLHLAGKEQAKEILKRLGETQYPEKDSLLFDKACELLDKTNDPVSFIREAKKKIAFHKALYIKLSNFTFFSQKEWNKLDPYKKREIEDCIDTIRATSMGLLQLIEQFEQSQVISGVSKRNRRDL